MTATATTWFNLPSRIDLLIAKVDAVAAQLGVNISTLKAIRAEQITMAETVQDIVNKIAAQTTILQSISTAATALASGQSNIAAEIASLKQQLAAGNTQVDFSPIDAALATQDGVIASLSQAIPANTSSGGPTGPTGGNTGPTGPTGGSTGASGPTGPTGP